MEPIISDQTYIFQLLTTSWLMMNIDTQSNTSPNNPNWLARRIYQGSAQLHVPHAGYFSTLYILIALHNRYARPN